MAGCPRCAHRCRRDEIFGNHVTEMKLGAAKRLNRNQLVLLEASPFHDGCRPPSSTRGHTELDTLEVIQNLTNKCYNDYP